MSSGNPPSESKTHLLSNGFVFGGPLDKILPQPLWAGTNVTPLPKKTKKTDRDWMMEALRESLSGIGITNPNPSVGCVLVDREGKEIARGSTEAYLGRHGEAVAFQKVTDPQRLKEATAYVTLEPCSHTGNQPPCVDLLVKSPIRRVFIARKDPNPLINGQGIRKLLDAGKEVNIGLLHPEVTAWNFPFFAHQILGRPVVILKWAQTLDGQLADDAHHSKWITSAPARAYTHWLRQRYDAILVGAKTFLHDAPRLNVRDCALPHQHSPVPIVLDPRGHCFDSKELAQQAESKIEKDDRKWIIVTTQEILDKNSKSWLAQHPRFTLLAIPGNTIASELIELLQSSKVETILGHSLQSIMIEGGAQTLSLFIRAGLADLFHVFTAPILTAGKKNRLSLDYPLQQAKRLELINTTQLGPDVVMELIPSEVVDSIF
jgi:diaminohydroxyphosphoribosylaminopyrimidine deaminase/5-amino-6-(5-phosphoribosylamino)uracil reductase